MTIDSPHGPGWFYAGALILVALGVIFSSLLFPFFSLNLHIDEKDPHISKLDVSNIAFRACHKCDYNFQSTCADCLKSNFSTKNYTILNKVNDTLSLFISSPTSGSGSLVTLHIHIDNKTKVSNIHYFCTSLLIREVAVLIRPRLIQILSLRNFPYNKLRFSSCL